MHWIAQVNPVRLAKRAYTWYYNFVFRVPAICYCCCCHCETRAKPFVNRLELPTVTAKTHSRIFNRWAGVRLDHNLGGGVGSGCWGLWRPRKPEKLAARAVCLRLRGLLNFINSRGTHAANVKGRYPLFPQKGCSIMQSCRQLFSKCCATSADTIISPTNQLNIQPSGG